MSGGTLKVDTAMLQTAGICFRHAGIELADLRADAPLGEAASAVPQLRTADACQRAESEIADRTTALAEGARAFGDNLSAAADWYRQRDQASAEAIKKIEVLG